MDTRLEFILRYLKLFVAKNPTALRFEPRTVCDRTGCRPEMALHVVGKGL